MTVHRAAGKQKEWMVLVLGESGITLRHKRKSPHAAGFFQRHVLLESVRVVEDQTGLIGVGAHVAAVGTVTQGGAEVLQQTALDHVVDAHVAFPLGVVRITGTGCLDVIGMQVGDRSLQARYADTAEVVGVLGERGVLASTGERVDHAVGEQVDAGTAVAFVAAVAIDDVAVVDERHAAVIAHLLVAGEERVTSDAVGEDGTPGLVVDFTWGPGVAAVVVEAVANVTVLAVGAAVEVAQVGLERLICL